MGGGVYPLHTGCTALTLALHLNGKELLAVLAVLAAHRHVQTGPILGLHELVAVLPAFIHV